jgi:hypothetical protein
VLAYVMVPAGATSIVTADIANVAGLAAVGLTVIGVALGTGNGGGQLAVAQALTSSLAPIVFNTLSFGAFNTSAGE